MALVHPFVPNCHVYYGHWGYNRTACEPALAKMPKSEAPEVYAVNPGRPVGHYNLPVTYENSDCKLNTPLASDDGIDKDANQKFDLSCLRNYCRSCWA